MTRKALSLLLLVLALLASCRKPEPQQGPLPSASVVRSALAPAPPASAAPEPAAWTRPLLFRVTQGSTLFFVFGTIHLPDVRLETFPPELQAAFDQSSAVFTEIPLDDATQAGMAPLLLLPEGKALSTTLPQPIYGRLSAAFGAKGVPMTAIDRMKPWAVTMQLALLDHMFAFALRKPIDAVLFQRAAASHKQTGALETAKEQLGIFDSLSEREQLTLLVQALDYKDKMAAAKRDVLEELFDAYLAGKDEDMMRLMLEEYDPKDALSVKLMKRIFTDRNKSMTERITREMKAHPEEVQLFAVGAGHVVGADGIARRLGKGGFQVTRVVP